MAAADLIPSADQVAALITSRTVDEYGNELGTFAAGTRPTDVQVSTLAAVAAADTLVALGAEADELPAEYIDEARQLAALRCAALILWSFYPEQQVAALGSAAASLQAAFVAGVAELVERLRWTAVRLA